MDITNLIQIGILAAVFISIILLIKSWITIYNKFVYWRTKAERKFADIDVITQQRIDMINALAQVAKKYSIHEWKTLKETIEARSRWTKDTPLSEKVRNTQEIENNFIKIQAVFEKYPRIKADSLYKSIMGHGNISRIESRLRGARLEYNRTVQQYNERLMRFPRKIVARVHGFEKFNYLDFSNQEQYRPKEIFND
jgi:LemA protein